MKRQIIFSLLMAITLSSVGQLTITVAPLNPTICPGDSVLLTATGAITYSWSPSSGLSSTNGASVYAFPSTTTTYFVTGTDGGNTGSTSVTVNVGVSPTVTASSSNMTICLGDSAMLTASGATTYSWSGGLGTSNPVTVAPTITTTYTVTGTSFGCTGSGSITIYVDSCSGISETENENNIQIFQNLLDNKITVQISDFLIHNDAIIALYDINGQLMIQQSIKQNKTDINISGLAKGMYFLELLSNDKIKVTKFFKE